MAQNRLPTLTTVSDQPPLRTAEEVMAPTDTVDESRGTLNNLQSTDSGEDMNIDKEQPSIEAEPTTINQTNISQKESETQLQTPKKPEEGRSYKNDKESHCRHLTC